MKKIQKVKIVIIMKKIKMIRAIYLEKKERINFNNIFY